MTAEASFTSTFARALEGDACYVVGLYDEPAPISVARWSAPADEDDQALLDLCHGPTLDIGCGPGRMTEALAERGQIVLGIDVVPEAVRQTNRRGASALRRNVFDPLPAEGRWHTALLADGNVGIGGDPVALLTRAGQLLDPAGRVVVELAEPGVRTRTVWAALECGTARSRPFRWSVVGVDDIAVLAATARLLVESTRRLGPRWVALLRKGSG